VDPREPPLNYPLTAIISDLHSNRPALDTALADARERGVSRFVCLGDVVGYGADPLHALDQVMGLCVAEPEDGDLAAGLCLQGNHEFALLGSAEDFNVNARSAIEWTRAVLNGKAGQEGGFALWDFLASLPPVDRDEVAMFAHGSPRDPVHEYMLPRDIQNENKMKANFACMDRGVCFIGHSHVPAVYFEDQRLFRPSATEGPYDLGPLDESKVIVNVGSVGQPRDGDTRLSYVLFDGARVTFVRLEYDVEEAMASIRAVPELPDYLADRLAVGR